MTDQLALLDEAPSTEPNRETVDWWNDFCHKTYSLPEGWKWFRLEAKGKPPHEFILVTGAVCTAVFERGPRKGHTDWKKRDKATEAQLAIPRDALRVFKRQWEMNTGKCSNCCGSGQEFESWSIYDGTKYRPCKPCGATGRRQS